MDTLYFGVDVSKDHLDIACSGRVERIDNNKTAIKRFIKSMAAGCVVGMESTNDFYYLMADMCYVAGMKVHVLNPRITRHYREVMALRGHTDRLDALTLSRFIEKEHENLRPYVPLTHDQRRLKRLVRRRSKLVEVKGQITQSMRGVKEIAKSLKAVIVRLEKLIEEIEALIEIDLKDNDNRKRIQGITGIGPVVSAALVLDLESRRFASADAFVAFYGLDLKANDSGRKKGRRKLSKQGDRLCRSLLFNAAMSACTTNAWSGVYNRCLERELSKIQALVILARKIARTAWSIYTHKTEFDPARITAPVQMAA